MYVPSGELVGCAVWALGRFEGAIAGNQKTPIVQRGLFDSLTSPPSPSPVWRGGINRDGFASDDINKTKVQCAKNAHWGNKKDAQKRVRTGWRGWMA